MGHSYVRSFSHTYGTVAVIYRIGSLPNGAAGGEESEDGRGQEEE